MTKDELIEVLSTVPDDADVYFYNSAENRYYIVDVAYFDGYKCVLEENI